MKKRPIARNGGSKPARPDRDRSAPPAQRRAERPSPTLSGGLRLVHEDNDVLVVDKPTGLLTAGLPGQDIEAAFNYVKAYVRDQVRRRGTRVWIVHRLDKEASGLLVFAKTEKAFEWLKEDFRAKRVHRLYAAVVEGEIGPQAPDERSPRGSRHGRDGAKPPTASRGSQLPSGTIQSFLFENDQGLVQSVASPTSIRRDGDAQRDGPKLAVTHWRVVATGSGRSMLQVRLETGRKNQIRVHMKEFGRPIVGDRRYGAESDPLGRVCLHAMELGFNHPATGQMVRFRSPTPGSFWGLVGKKSDAATSSQSDQDHRPARDFSSEAKDPLATPEPREPARARGPRDIASSWDHVADWYNELLEDRASDHHERVIIPGALRLLQPRRGMRILDLACGQGILCRQLSALGVSAIGVDSSARLIDAAKRAGYAAGSAPIEYHVGDARRLETMDLGEFDAVACVMALMNIDPISPVLSGVASRLKTGGAFVAVILHPAFRSPGQTSWGWDTTSMQRTSGAADRKGRASAPRLGDQVRQYRRVDGYLSPGQREIVMNPGGAARGERAVTTLTYHRPVQTYIKAFAAAGLLVDGLEEWPSLRQSEPGPRATEENRSRREIPMFLGLRGVKAAHVDV